ncbi:hypothetical protein DRP44_03510 [candidate division TA06 bacterium]|uniref:Type 4a pilus biogenesis protein PilO n=1 Tax=candidate division TA06 bacterium TaxID=2250710 RepID=A0A660S962_UNCT6|nr:MAG: hypothetical protein DRP44_03510 [candidate division TA06 bacterium]
MDKKNIIILSTSALLLIIIIVLWSVLIINKNNAKIRTLKDEHTKISTKLSNARRVAASLDDVKKKYHEMELQWQKASSMLPDRIETAQVIKIIGRLASQQNVKITKFSPAGGVTSSGEYSSAKYKISVESDFNNLGIFLTRLGMTKRIVKTLSFNVGENKKKESKTGRIKTVKADFQIETYALNPGLRPPKTTKKKGGK